MAAIAPIIAEDPTLKAADRALEELAAKERQREYLGMSEVGGSCSRKLWYGFRKAARERFDAATLKRFEDGHRTEDLIIRRLRLLDGITLLDRQADGNQIGYKDLNGHFSGHLDGDIVGILQAPVTPHVLEVKCVSEKKFNELKKAVAELGEKNALRKWNPVYYTQGMLYCHYHQRSRHYLVVATPGGRDWMGVRSNYDAAHALGAIAKANRIISSQEPPDKLSNDPSYFECRYCYYSGICHRDDMPDRGCRTCLHSTAIENGAWHCARWGKTLTFDEQLAGCQAHKFLPGIVPGEAIAADEKSVTYKLKNGAVWRDGET
jgi:hypothetical protein